MHDFAGTHTVVVVGSGTAGLIAAYELRKLGIPVRILEKEKRVGEQWRKRHPQLSLNTHRNLSTLPGIQYRDGTSAFPHRDAVVAHIEDFVRFHRIPIEFDVEVSSIRHDNGIFCLDTTKGMVATRNVIIATGRDSRPWMPYWEGIGEFPGKLIHSSDFGDAKDYSGKRVLVVGGGNSGIDVLNHLTKVDAAEIWLSARHGPTLLPKRLFGVTIHRVSPLTSRLPDRVADFVLSLTSRLAFGDLSSFGLPKPTKGGASRLKDQVALALDDGAAAAIKTGVATIVPEVEKFGPSGVTLIDRQVIKPNVVIAATGYTTGLEDLVGQFGILDSRGRSTVNGSEELPRTPGLWFIGMRASLLGDVAVAKVQAKMIAKALAAVHRR